MIFAKEEENLVKYSRYDRELKCEIYKEPF
jgi:hypothetical protein